MSIPTVQIGKLSVSKMIIGGNPFSGFSHQSPARDDEMRHYHTTERIKHTLSQAEQLGINAHIGRGDHHVMRCLMEYWDEGGQIQWIAQTCPEIGTTARGVANAINGGAVGCHIHGGVMELLLNNNETDEIAPAIEQMKAGGLAAGVAGHDPAIHLWAEENLDLDYHMCSYYRPNLRDKNAEHVPGAPERFDDKHRDAMVEVIATLSKPVIHYKVLAAGRHDPAEALEFVLRHLRPQDAVCIGICLKDNPNSIGEDLRLLGLLDES